MLDSMGILRWNQSLSYAGCLHVRPTSAQGRARGIARSNPRAAYPAGNRGALNVHEDAQGGSLPRSLQTETSFLERPEMVL